MNLYLISQTANNDYDTYDSAVVVAESLADAVKVSPSSFYKWHEEGGWHFQYADGTERPFGVPHDWVMPKDVTAVLIGSASAELEPGHVICASFNAG